MNVYLSPDPFLFYPLLAPWSSRESDNGESLLVYAMEFAKFIRMSVISSLKEYWPEHRILQLLAWMLDFSKYAVLHVSKRLYSTEKAIWHSTVSNVGISFFCHFYGHFVQGCLSSARCVRSKKQSRSNKGTKYFDGLNTEIPDLPYELECGKHEIRDMESIK